MYNVYCTIDNKSSTIDFHLYKTDETLSQAKKVFKQTNNFFFEPRFGVTESSSSCVAVNINKKCDHKRGKSLSIITLNCETTSRINFHQEHCLIIY